MDTAHSSKTISATHSLLPNSVNSAFLQRSMCVGFLFFFFFLLLVLFLFCFVFIFCYYWCIGLGVWGEGCGEIGLLFHLGGEGWGGGDEVW